MVDARLIPVLIAAGEILDRPTDARDGLEPLDLMLEALRRAEAAIGRPVLNRLDWLGVEEQISFPEPAIHQRLSACLAAPPGTIYRTPKANGDGPTMMINMAANLIGGGEIGLAAIVGAEAMRTASRLREGTAQRKLSGATPQSNQRTELARRFGIVTPTDVYPLYENALRAASGQTLAEAQAETAMIWSRFSEVAAANPFAWLRKEMPPEAIATIGDDNRMISFPYTKLMVANASVNMGAAVIVASLAVARDLGIGDEDMVYVGAGASAHEPEDYFARDRYDRLASMEATITSALALNGLSRDQIDHVELYSCFPCVPKLARRVLDWPTDRPASFYGGLTFGGGPIGNCMTHAVAGVLRKLRNTGSNALVVANGGFATHSHSIVFSRKPPATRVFPQDVDVQAQAEAARAQVPVVLDHFTGRGTVETFTVPFDRTGSPRFGVVVCRNDAGARFLASVPGSDTAGLAALMSEHATPIGTVGQAIEVDGVATWRPA